MSPPASNFDQRSSSVINQYYSSAAAKAASKKLSQAKWYQKCVFNNLLLPPTQPLLETKSVSDSVLVLVQRE